MSLRLTHARYIDQIQVQQQLLPCIIFHFDPASGDLQAQFWPVTLEGARVTPSNFNSYRNNHNFRAPCCLCASDAPENGYTECAVYIPLEGQHQGECGYIVCIERWYSRRGLLIDQYPRRQLGHLVPPTVYHLPTRNRLAVYDAQGSIPAQFDALPCTLPSLSLDEPSNRRRETTLNQLKSLDCWRRPGILESDFVKLFAKCRCGLIMTRRVFRSHICVARPPPVVIDLTIDSDDEIPIVID
ncbi:hypothetical protein PILCRDRAFT_90500 [Piloderma croceum F 1598]|uniref:Uncharacterized protein n=1 Tax=Piloderma croceum (strain F 1598) TaxID=765440 RepID=A0A0C3BN61_PILCF|nr:hypothetical protein PILCRDRAFT_90500 [Piloderma croceum F 1598]